MYWTDLGPISTLPTSFPAVMVDLWPLFRCPIPVSLPWRFPAAVGRDTHLTLMASSGCPAGGPQVLQIEDRPEDLKKFLDPLRCLNLYKHNIGKTKQNKNKPLFVIS